MPLGVWDAAPILGLKRQLGAGASQCERPNFAPLRYSPFLRQLLRVAGDFSVFAHGIRGLVATQRPLELKRLPALARARGDLLPFGAAVREVGADRDRVGLRAVPLGDRPINVVHRPTRSFVGEVQVECFFAEGVADGALVDFLASLVTRPVSQLSRGSS